MSVPEQSAVSLLPFMGVVGGEASADFARFHVIPAPHDAVTTQRPGARFGPEALLRASQPLERFDEEINTEAWRIGIHTTPPIQSHPGDLERVALAVKVAVADRIKRGKLPIVIGGDHSVATPAIEACIESGTSQITALHLGARPCLRESVQGSDRTSLSAMKRLQGRTRIVEVGMRACTEPESKALNDGMIKSFPMHSMRRRQISDVITEIGQAVRGGVFIALSLDVFDPSVMPSVGAPEPGGLLWWETLALLRTVISNSSVVGMSITELTPIPGLDAPNITAARLVYKLMGYIAKYQAFWRQGETIPPAPAPPAAPPPSPGETPFRSPQ